MPFREMRSGGRPVMSSPLNRMRPEVGRSTPVRQLKKVLLPAPFGPMIARISPRRDFEVDVVERGQTAEADGQALGAQHGVRFASPAGLGRGAPMKRRDRPALSANLQAGGKIVFSFATTSRMLVLAVLDLEDELAQEGLVVFLAQHLVALREVVAFLHLEPFERLDQLRRVLAAAELRLLHAELQARSSASKFDCT